MRNTRTLTLLPLLLGLCLCGGAMAAELKVNKVNGAKEELIYSILELAISKVDRETKPKQLKDELPLGRLAKAVENSTVDIMWAGSSADYDNRLLAIRIPLLKGLLGHRVFIIKPENQPKFDSVKTLEDLAKLKAGLNSRWGSTRVLKNAGLDVVESTSYENLFHMLDSGRFDFYPRAVHEPWAELQDRPELNLAIEKNILIIYPYAMHFYVKKNNKPLKDFIEKGLEIAIADGSFDELFFNNPMIKKPLKILAFSVELLFVFPTLFCTQIHRSNEKNSG